MQVIKHGNTYRTYACRECTCAFEAAKKDVVFDEYGNEYLECPECGHQIAIRPKE